MSVHRTLEAHAPWVQLETSDDDWDAAAPHLLTTMYAQLVLIRTFEEYVLELAGEGLVHGPAHSSIGQEGGAVGSILALGHADTVNGSHRGHHQFLAKTLRHVEPEGIDPTAPYTHDVRELLLRTLAEICGLARGFSHGRGGSMHLQWKEAGAIGTNAIVGGGVPLAAGSAWAHRHAGTDAVAVTYFGDGAANIGSTLETFNLAAAWKLPLCFFIENNQYAVSTSVTEATAEPRLSARGPGFGVPSFRVDGMNPLAVHLTMQEALLQLRSGAGPVLIEGDTYRFFHQNGSLPGSAFRYRSKAEEQTWRARDPLAQVRTHLVRRGILSPTGCDAAVSQAQRLMADLGAELLEELPPGAVGRRRIRPSEWPDPAFTEIGLRGDLSEFDGVPMTDRATFAGAIGQVKFIDAVAAVMARRMATDDRIVVLGEDVHRLNGGTNGATRGLEAAYPSRVLGTPISENAFAGLAGGMALDGRFTPVVEFMYADFMWVAADQLFNQIGKARHMFGGTDPVPLVLRSKVAMGTGYGSQHSMDPAGIFATAPGWRVVAPSTPFDYVGLMNSALRCQDPVVVLEHVDLYSSIGEGPVDDYDYCLPIGKAAVRRTGSAVTVLTYLAMTTYVLQAVQDVETVDAEVIDLRWLDRASLDWDTIGASIRKTNRVLIAEQGSVGTSYGGWLSDEIQRRYFDCLDHPVMRVTGGEASPSISRVLERAAIAKDPEVATALTGLAGIPPKRRIAGRDPAAAAAANTTPPQTKKAATASQFQLRATARADRLVKLRAELNDAGSVHISMNDLVVLAVARAHRDVPGMNVSRAPDPVRAVDSIDIALCVDTPTGPVTPVVFAVDELSITALAATTAALIERARTGQLDHHELDSGAITVLDLAAHGATEFAALANPPHAALLAVGAVTLEPVVHKRRVAVSSVMRLTLSVDHQQIDATVASRWMRGLVNLIEHPTRILA